MKYTNPVASRGADPWVLRHNDTYYYCFSVGNGVAVRKCENLASLAEGETAVVYRAPEGTMYSREYWAPELHYLDGRFYIYVATDDGRNENHRMYVLRATTDSPLDPFEMVGKITDSTDKWAIDGTVLTYRDQLYFVWSGWEGDENLSQYLYLAKMDSPTSIGNNPRVEISRPDHEWECRSCGGGLPTINEGPAALCRGDAVHIVYSASGSWSDDYCLGILTFRGGEITDPGAWVKGDAPIFEKAPGAYGPGHCSFASTDRADYVIYHANEVSKSGWGGRSVRVQPLSWDGDTPVLGTPAAPGEEIELL